MSKWYPNAKVYCDGVHYIAIPYEPNPSAKHRRPEVEEIVEVDDHTAAPTQAESETTDACETETPVEDTTSTESQSTKRHTTKKAEFERLYRESFDLTPKRRRKYILSEMKKLFPHYNKMWEYVSEKLEEKNKALNAKRQRFMRKAHLNNFNYFATFTYDSAKMDEVTFKWRLMRTLQNFHTARGWTYMGVWERGSETERLHFHCLLNVPEGQMVGMLQDTREYNKKSGRMVEYTHNTFFDEKYGRNEFDMLATKGPMYLGSTIDYILKYIEKTGEKIVYSRGLPMYVMSDIEDKDVIMRTGMEDKKLLLFEDFDCWDEGVYVGVNSEETRAQLRKSN
ncbi:MAG: hypothetical protein II896_02540 [Clostridia bacterium]|nr:hypothetical protein [Clostridia bacterium]